jgi:hypothetical protein
MINGWEEIPFTDVNGSSVTIKYSDLDTELIGTAELKVNGDSGEVTGTDQWSYSDDSDNCIYTESIIGEIIL